MKCDIIAQGISTAKTLKLSVPLVVRLRGERRSGKKIDRGFGPGVMQP